MDASNADVKSLVCRPPWRRLRIGDYRVLFRTLDADEIAAIGIEDNAGTLVARIVHRRDLERSPLFHDSVSWPAARPATVSGPESAPLRESASVWSSESPLPFDERQLRAEAHPGDFAGEFDVSPRALRADIRSQPPTVLQVE